MDDFQYFMTEHTKCSPKVLLETVQPTVLMAWEYGSNIWNKKEKIIGKYLAYICGIISNNLLPNIQLF